MIGHGTSRGCISVMNGIVNGTGAVIGISLETSADYEECGTEQKVIISGGDVIDDTLVRICVRKTLNALGIDANKPYRVTVRSEIPPSRGLKSSSSVCNAVIKSVLDLYGRKMDPMDVVLLGVECAREAKVTITGSFDDAYGCEMGGFAITDNTRDIVLRSEPFPKYDVVLCIPERTKKAVPKETYNAASPEMEEIGRTCETDILAAMTMNGRLIAKITGEDPSTIDKALSMGALAAGISGTGPAVAIIAAKGDGKRIADRMECETIIAETR